MRRRSANESSFRGRNTESTLHSYAGLHALTFVRIQSLSYFPGSQALRFVIRFLTRSRASSQMVELAAHGVGVHHAGLSFEDRRAVEESFLDGTLQVLVATSVCRLLPQPARRSLMHAVLADTRRWG